MALFIFFKKAIEPSLKFALCDMTRVRLRLTSQRLSSGVVAGKADVPRFFTPCPIHYAFSSTHRSKEYLLMHLFMQLLYSIISEKNEEPIVQQENIFLVPF
jgi:hypothetical protein